MTGKKLTTVTDRIVAAIIVIIIQIHPVQNCQRLHAIIGNGSYIVTKPMEIDINVDEMGRIVQSSTPSSCKAQARFQVPYLIPRSSCPRFFFQ